MTVVMPYAPAIEVLRVHQESQEKRMIDFAGQTHPTTLQLWRSYADLSPGEVAMLTFDGID